MANDLPIGQAMLRTGNVVDSGPGTGQPRSNVIVRENPGTASHVAPGSISPAANRAWPAPLDRSTDYHDDQSPAQH